MTTIQITLTALDLRQDQNWGHARQAIDQCTPINRELKVRDGLSGRIDTYSDGFRVQVDVFDAFAHADQLARALFDEWAVNPDVDRIKFDQVREAVLAGITGASRLDA